MVAPILEKVAQRIRGQALVAKVNRTIIRNGLANMCTRYSDYVVRLKVERLFIVK